MRNPSNNLITNAEKQSNRRAFQIIVNSYIYSGKGHQNSKYRN